MIRKKAILVLLVMVIMATNSTTVHAFSGNRIGKGNLISSGESVQETAVDTTKDLLKEYGMNATAFSVSMKEEITIWFKKIKNSDAYKEHEDMLELDGYKEVFASIAENAVRVEDNNNKGSSVYYFFKQYENKDGHRVYTLYVYTTAINDVLQIYSQEGIVKDGGEINLQDYYMYHNANIASTSFDSNSFLCSLSGDLACGFYGAMIAAASAGVGFAIGLGCSVAWSYLCAL